MFEKITAITEYIKRVFFKKENEKYLLNDDEEYEEFLRLEEKRIKNIDRNKESFDPLKPYYKPFAYNKSCEKELIKKFEEQGRRFTAEQYNEIFTKLISKENFLSKEKATYLKNIWEDAKFVSKTLKPLKAIGLSYGLDLTGGSVRDFILDNQDKIKDLDFMLSIQGVDRKTFVQIENFFEPKELFKVNWDFSLKNTLVENSEAEICDEKKILPEDILKAKLVQLCFNRIDEQLEVYDHTSKRFNVIGKNNYGDDIFRKDRLISVIKTTGKNTNYPVDILLTDYTKNDFVDDFDFDICKATICFENEFVDKSFPEHYTHLISRFVGRVEFFADVYNKTVTYDTTKRTEWLINQSFEDHLPRILKKYPDLKVLVVGENELKKLAESKAFSMQLNKDLSNKQNTPKAKVGKI